MWSMTTPRDKAEQLRRLHHQGAWLLPNAWDAVSARLFEQAGFPAIGTTSAGVAYACGYPDGQHIGRDEMLQALARITRSVQVPITADVEAGYGSTPAEVAATVQGVIAAGAVGINLEDNTSDPAAPLYPLEVQAERIAAARAEAQRADLPLLINARIDTYHALAARLGDAETRLAGTVLRAQAYLHAGADGIFVPFVVDRSTIQALAQQIAAPLNIMAVPGAPVAAELFQLGVARISIGPGAMLATMGLVRNIAQELREQGAYATIQRHAYAFTEAQALFEPGARFAQ
jgi:2-methylisocitrate lyase-like PEP mutase family enzyme